MLNSKKLIFVCSLFLLSPIFGKMERLDSQNNASYFSTEHKSIHGTDYFIITPKDAYIDFEIVRPSKSDNNILLCVAGAYTDLKSFGIDGLYVSKGKVYNKDHINYTLDGGIKIVDKKVEIFPTNQGKLLSEQFLKKITEQEGAFFQQTQCIANGVIKPFKEARLFQRRGVIVFKAGGYAIVESEKPITLKTFSDDMIFIGAKDLLNFDMGDWDEGWYRNPNTNKITVLGQRLRQTTKQSNWVVLKKMNK